MLTLRSKPPLKKSLRLARRKNIDLWSTDECHFCQHGSRIAMWIPPEDKDPKVLLAPTRKSISLFGAVNVKDGRLVTRFEEKFDAMTFKDFIIQLLRTKKSGRKIVVILDNAKYHHAKLLRPFLAEHRKSLRLEFLPAYSPDLNPIERVWKLTRRICTHNVHFENLCQLKTVVQVQQTKWRKPNTTLARLCCII